MEREGEKEKEKGEGYDYIHLRSDLDSNATPSCVASYICTVHLVDVLAHCGPNPFSFLPPARNLVANRSHLQRESPKCISVGTPVPLCSEQHTLSTVSQPMAAHMQVVALHLSNAFISAYFRVIRAHLCDNSGTIRSDMLLLYLHQLAEIPYLRASVRRLEDI